MLPLKNRLKKDKDFQYLFDKGKTFSYRFLYFKIRQNSLDSTRFGFIVSKKVSNKAVIRNKIKRKLRAIIRGRIDRIKRGFDIAIVVKPIFKMKDFGNIQGVVEFILERLGLYDENH